MLGVQKIKSIKMNDLTLLKMTKRILKCLVDSSIDRLTIETLNLNYCRQEGRSIPFAQLGYSSLSQFLLDIPDSLTVWFVITFALNT